MSDLTEFLLARIGEDEAAAREALPGPWVWDAGDTDGQGCIEGDLKSSQPAPVEDWLGGEPWFESVVGSTGEHAMSWVTARPGDRNHIARHDPARVLAECEAKRRIVEELRGTAEDEHEHYGWVRMAMAPLQYLAAVYADHPDYRDEWRVSP